MATIERLSYMSPEDHNKILTVTGISGSGKDYLVNHARLLAPDIIGDRIAIFNFGSKLFQSLTADLGPLSIKNKDDLKNLPVEVINCYVAQTIQKLLDCQPALYLNHVVWKQQGKLMINPESEYKVNSFEYIFIHAEPDLISTWRLHDQKNRPRELESIDQIALHQEIAQLTSLAIARQLGAGFIRIDNRPNDIIESTAVVLEEAKRML